MITIDRLRYFKEAAIIQHVGLAASNLSISPSVISSAIKVLEEELACKLFIRDKNKIKLNENGQLLLEKSHYILSNVENLYSEINKSHFQLRGHSKIGASPFLMREYLVDTFLKIQKDHPEITAEFSSLDTGQAISSILNGRLDFALVFRSIEHQDLDEHILYEGKFQIAVRKNHPILKAKDKLKSLNDFPAVTFKTPTDPTYMTGHPLFKKNGVSPSHTIFYNNNDISLKILRKTDAWSFLPDLIVEKNKKFISPLKLTKDWEVPLKVSLIKNKSNISLGLFNLVTKNLNIS